MKPLSAVATVITAALMFAALPGAFANDMNGQIVPEHNIGEVQYLGFKNLTLRFPAGSAIADAFSEVDTKNIRISSAQITGNATSQDSAVVSAITAFNRALLDVKSPTQVSAIKLLYTADIKPNDEGALVSFKVNAVPTIEKFSLGDGNLEGLSSKIVDLEWRGIRVTEPILVDLKHGDRELGATDINRPIGLLEKLYPELAEQLKGSAADEIFTEPILDFRKFDQKLDTWHFLFDPSGSLVETSAFFREESGARVVSVYSLGESSFREGTFRAEEKEADTTAFGVPLSVHSQVPAPSGQIQVSGFSKADVSQPAAEIASVSVEAPAGASTATGGFPIQVLLVFGGMMGAIAIFILFKARK
ncbi:MAG: hypothetical protein ACRD99_05115 [Nitrososphaera sp.]